uniref:Uncharacterized protein n=1 Tax=Vespula pensylvanica TaxID=30213 RepID=A0A834P2W7_VESPE|nr:hypothetical protein H0235_007902 [Vespula pensylvanica]
MLAKWILVLVIINLIRILSPRDQFQSDTLGEAGCNDNNYVDDLGSDLERAIHYHVGGQDRVASNVEEIGQPSPNVGYKLAARKEPKDSNSHSLVSNVYRY